MIGGHVDSSHFIAASTGSKGTLRPSPYTDPDNVQSVSAQRHDTLKASGYEKPSQLYSQPVQSLSRTAQMDDTHTLNAEN